MKHPERYGWEGFGKRTFREKLIRRILDFLSKIGLI